MLLRELVGNNLSAGIGTYRRERDWSGAGGEHLLLAARRTFLPSRSFHYYYNVVYGYDSTRPPSLSLEKIKHSNK